MTSKRKLILQVEDDDNDVLFLSLAMKSAGMKVRVQIAVDGQQAVDYLSGAGEFADRTTYPQPSLVLLDLRIPKIPGLDVLKWMRQQPTLKHLPVLVLTSSDAYSDIQEAYRLGANSYLVKPVNPSDLLEVVEYIRDQWLDQRPKKSMMDKARGFIKPPLTVTPK